MSEAEPPPFRTALLAPRRWPAWLGVALFSLFALVPPRLRDPIAARVGDLQWHTNAKRRGIVELNLSQAYPDLDGAARRRLARDHFRAYAQVMADQGSLWWDWGRRIPESRCRVHGSETLQALQDQGHNLILLNAHTIAIEFGGVALSRHLPLAAIVKPVSEPVLDWIVARVRSRFGCALFARERGLRPVLRALQGGRCLYYSPDEDLGQRNSVFAPFFGQPKATLATLGRMARLLQARVVPVYAYYDAGERCYQVHVRPPLEGFPSGDAYTDARLMNAALEQSIALCPAQYLWNYRMFRTRPDGSRLAYPRRTGIGRHIRRRRRQRRRREQGGG